MRWLVLGGTVLFAAYQLLIPQLSSSTLWQLCALQLVLSITMCQPNAAGMCSAGWVPAQAVRSQLGLESPERLAASAPEPRRLPSNPLGSTSPSTPNAVSWPRPQHRALLPAAGGQYPGVHPGSSPGSTPARSMPASPAMSAKPPLPRRRSSDMPRGFPPPRRWSDPQVRTFLP